MAFLQSDIPPSTAPVSRASRALAVMPAAGRTARAVPVKRRSHRALQVIAVAAGAGLLLIPGYAAARATESLAMGILAADLVFLLGVALWSSVAGSPRR